MADLRLVGATSTLAWTCFLCRPAHDKRGRGTQDQWLNRNSVEDSKAQTISPIAVALSSRRSLRYAAAACRSLSVAGREKTDQLISSAIEPTSSILTRRATRLSPDGLSQP